MGVSTHNTILSVHMQKLVLISKLQGVYSGQELTLWSLTINQCHISMGQLLVLVIYLLNFHLILGL